MYDNNVALFYELMKMFKALITERHVVAAEGSVFTAHSCQCSPDSGPQGERENERLSRQQENRYENTFQAEQSLCGTIRGGTNLLRVLISIFDRSNRDSSG